MNIINSNYYGAGNFETFPDVLNVEQVGQALNMGRRKVYELIKNGELKSFNVGKRFRIPKKCLIAYIDTVTGQDMAS